MRQLAGTGLSAVAIATLLNACAMPAPAPDYAALLAAPDRTDADRKNDDRRQALKLLAFTGVRPGWKDLDMAADAGYSTELMARAVAPGGIVYGQNPPDAMPRVINAFLARMQRPAMKNVIDDRRKFDDPVPPNVTDLDLVTFFFGYHDTTYMPVDRAKMDKAMFNALKPGGYLVIADYAALPGAPVTTGKRFHRTRRKHREKRGRGGRIQARGRRQFPAQPERHARLHHLQFEDPDRHLRDQIPEAELKIAHPDRRARIVHGHGQISHDDRHGGRPRCRLPSLPSWPPCSEAAKERIFAPYREAYGEFQFKKSTGQRRNVD